MVHAHSPGLSLVLWGVGGVLSLLGALTYAEMGVMMPVAGKGDNCHEANIMRDCFI